MAIETADLKHEDVDVPWIYVGLPEGNGYVETKHVMPGIFHIILGLMLLKEIMGESRWISMNLCEIAATIATSSNQSGVYELIEMTLIPSYTDLLDFQGWGRPLLKTQSAAGLH